VTITKLPVTELTDGRSAWYAYRIPPSVVEVSSPQQITQLLIEVSKRNQAALEELMPLVYSELRRIAKRYMQQQNRRNILQTSDLIHEAYMRMAAGSGKQWQNRAHFLGVAASAMRHVLVDYARANHAAKRGGNGRAVSLNEAIVISGERLRELVALDDALDVLEKLSPRQSLVVELRFFWRYERGRDG
jgi:RNA polymerase sigma factor (TIGR02999 family)